MKTLPENIEKIEKEGKKFLPAIIILLIIAGIYIYNSTFYVIVRFDELGPLTKNMSAYYNGFKIGKIIRIQPDKDFKHILVKVDLNQKELNLPQNTVVYVERFATGELYLQFVYPSSPSLNKLRRGDMLEGIAPYNLEQFMMGQSISGMTDVVSMHIIQALNGADAANLEIKTFFQILSNLVNTNNKGINATVDNTASMTKSLAEMAENLNQASKKLNRALDEEILKDTTSNLKDTTKNISQATKDLDKTMRKIDSTISHLNSISSGLNETLCKRFGGIRVFFGAPVKQKCCK